MGMVIAKKQSKLDKVEEKNYFTCIFFFLCVCVRKGGKLVDGYFCSLYRFKVSL